MKTIKGINVWGNPILNEAVEQIVKCKEESEAPYAALMADHHVGYSLPIGGVLALRDKVSPNGVGFDIGCGNLCIRLDCDHLDIQNRIETIMDDVVNNISFGIGQVNNQKVESGIFDTQIWDLYPFLNDLKQLARNQLGTVGSGNHYVDIFADEEKKIWVGCHFGSRGLGHKITTHFLKLSDAKDGIDAPLCLIDSKSALGEDYILCMQLAADYACEGRKWVCNKVAEILGSKLNFAVHKHHNYAWQEMVNGEQLTIIRKGATPIYTNQESFIGGSMGDSSYIIRAKNDCEKELSLTLNSTIHGAGRLISRKKAAGKTKFKNGKRIRISEGLISREMMNEWVKEKNVCLRGADIDESPHCYKRIDEVLECHKDTVEIIHTLTPLGVAMAGSEFDPYKD